MSIWNHIQAVTGYDRAAIKEIVFCFCYGGAGSQTLFDVARRHKFDLEAIGKIRGAADEWLRGGLDPKAVDHIFDHVGRVNIKVESAVESARKVMEEIRRQSRRRGL